MKNDYNYFNNAANIFFDSSTHFGKKCYNEISHDYDLVQENL